MSHAFSYVHAHILVDFDNVVFLHLFLDVVCAFGICLGKEKFKDSLHGEHGYTGWKRHLIAIFFYVTSTALFIS